MQTWLVMFVALLLTGNAIFFYSFYVDSKNCAQTQNHGVPPNNQNKMLNKKPSSPSDLLTQQQPSSSFPSSSSSSSSFPSSPCKKNAEHSLEDVGIFIRTYRKHAPMIPYVLRSIWKYWPFYPRIALLYPIVDAPKVEEHLLRFMKDKRYPDEFKQRISTHKVVDFLGQIRKSETSISTGYIDQQLWKIKADEFLETPIIMHVDCDTVFWRKLIHEDVFENGTNIVRMYFSTHTTIQSDSREFIRAAMQYKEPTDQVLGIKRPITESRDYMRIFPITYPREVYRLLRQRIYQVHGMTLEHLLLQKNIASLSEFNILGANTDLFHHDLMFFHERFRDKVHKEPVTQLWSHFMRGQDGGDLSSEEDKKVCNSMSEEPGCLL